MARALRRTLLTAALLLTPNAFVEYADGVRDSLRATGSHVLVDAIVAQDVRFTSMRTWTQYRWYILGTAAVVLLQTLLIAGLLAQHARRRRAEEASRTSENQLRASYGRIRQLAGQLITAQESTRRRIALDLHDDICQELVGLSLAVGELRRRQGVRDDEDPEDPLAGLQRRTVDLVDRVRRLSHELHPATLTHVGLAAALESHCIEIEQRYDVQVTFNAAGDLRRLRESAALGLFRIAQEAMRNAATHGDARRITVNVALKDRVVELTVADDGRGFDLEEARAVGQGLGLVSMDERAHLLDGRFSIDTSRGRGAVVRVRVPAEAETAAADADAGDAVAAGAVAPYPETDGAAR